MGIVPQALFNFLTLLGWSPGGDREIFSKEEAAAMFDLRHCGIADTSPRARLADSCEISSKVAWHGGCCLRGKAIFAEGFSR